MSWTKNRAQNQWKIGLRERERGEQKWERTDSYDGVWRWRHEV
jgi:hypothetical protein